MAHDCAGRTACLGWPRSPKLSAMAVIERADFATVLERAIEGSGKANAIKQLAPPEPE
jgi:hypothetical protein